MNIVCLSGGKMSFYCADYAVKKYGVENVMLYFNDTKWEHADLYRFLKDIEYYFSKKIIIDADGRTPEQVFFDEKFLGNDRVPLCSKMLKAKRMQAYYKNNDNLIFGIGFEEKHRVPRIVAAYQKNYVLTGRYCTLEFPIVENNVMKNEIDTWFKRTGVQLPELYRLGFDHNNCSGGCVRQGKKQWRHLLDVLSEVYAQREQLEESFRMTSKKDVHFLKDITLRELRECRAPILDFENDYTPECIGICEFVN
jgi:3'-phosphoadenosine 5'-phosphosulfate sulfotransferase (PAPS reductase)/FAD synthetase